MFSLLLAAAVSAATPTMKADIPNDAPAICAARFEEQVRLKLNSVTAKMTGSIVIDTYARVTKLSAKNKQMLTNYCDMFDLGADYFVSHYVQGEDEQEHRGLRKPFDDVASFTR